jgi:hypothetical protein
MVISQCQQANHESGRPEWLLLLFTLPASQASRRVEVWRKLKRFGALSFRSSGYLLPSTPENCERFEWLSAAIRRYKGQASVAELFSIDDLPCAELRQMFIDARSEDYESLLRELKKKQSATNLPRMRRRLQEIVDIDFFGSPFRSRVETALASREMPPRQSESAATHKKQEFLRRTWVTRPRPGIDRVSSAWLIRNYIDPDARFVFTNTNDVREVPDGVPFDMFNVVGFTHQGDNCTFETFCIQFGIKDRRIKVIAEIIHDADLNDEKYRRIEGVGLDRVLSGWVSQGVADEEVLRRGMELVEGLYRGIK